MTNATNTARAIALRVQANPSVVIHGVEIDSLVHQLKQAVDSAQKSGNLGAASQAIHDLCEQAGVDVERSPDALRLRGQVRRQSDDREGAFADLSKALAFGFAEGWDLVSAASCLNSMGLLALGIERRVGAAATLLAIEFFRLAQTVSPSSSQPYSNEIAAVSVLRESGWTERALEVMRTAEQSCTAFWTDPSIRDAFQYQVYMEDLRCDDELWSFVSQRLANSNEDGPVIPRLTGAAPDSDVIQRLVRELHSLVSRSN